MTASPIDAKVDLVQASQQLEELLDCKIATYELKDEFKNKATDHTVYYSTLKRPTKTRLYAMLEEKIGDMPDFKRYFDTALPLSSYLGPWAAEKYWEYALRPDEINKAVGRLQHDRFIT